MNPCGKRNGLAHLHLPGKAVVDGGDGHGCEAEAGHHCGDERVEGLRRRRTGERPVGSGVKNRTQPEPARRNEPRGGTAAEMLASMPRFAHAEKTEEEKRDLNVKIRKFGGTRM
ncbi:hypothetical protein DsansV1_C08g0080191 [Dioscorea sansibarensis]